ncbi:hypothetical protein [Candidatus Uabimicrobium sp. HlEnr_7]|uniref:hypothetical protein n=1 Tax=Candidatus Uabimicrobium helgolandensis TaxID=3095367 RepID=UPI00355922E2
MISFGVLLSTAVLLEFTATNYFILQPQGIFIGKKGSDFSIHWNNIDSFFSSEYCDNPIFCINVLDIEAVIKTTNERKQKKLRKEAQWTLFGRYTLS